MPVEPLSLSLARVEAVQQIQSLIGQAERSALAASGRLSVESARTADASVAATQEAVQARIHGGSDGEGAGEGAPERREDEPAGEAPAANADDPAGRGARVDILA